MSNIDDASRLPGDAAETPVATSVASLPEAGVALTDQETKSLISADKVQGTVVYNRSNERLGTVDQIMINKRSGLVAYSVMSFGGFLGIGERYHILPWSILDYDVDRGGYCIDVDRETLTKAPNYSRDEVTRFDYDEGAKSADSYYGATGAYATPLG